MANELAEALLLSGRGHGESSCLLYRASIEQAEREGFEYTADYAFNGPYSLSVQNLLGLSLELMLKSAIVAWDPDATVNFLRNEVRHDLVVALDEAERRGFSSQAHHLRELVTVLRDPYHLHWFRYERPNQFNLPGDFDQIVEVLHVLHGEVSSKLTPLLPAEPDG